jgi:hypothetical protein
MNDTMIKEKVDGIRSMYSVANLNLAKHVGSKRLEYAEHFIEVIIRSGIERRSYVEYVPINFGVLRGVIPDKVIKPLKADLLNAGVIETDGQYIKGEKSIGYRLGPQYRGQEITLGRVKPKSRRLRDGVHTWLRKQFATLDIDLPLANRLMGEYIAALPALKREGYSGELAIVPALQIAQHSTEFSVCKYGRVHTSLTRMPKALRNALNVNGEPLYCLDIANSQPLMLGIIARNVDHFRNVQFNKTQPYNSISLPTHTQSTPKPLSIMNSIPGTQFYMPLQNKPFPSNAVLPKATAFLDVCERGQFYEMFGADIPRDQIKTGLFQVLYGTNRSHSNLKDKFKALFPDVYAMIYELKINDYAYLPRLMQLVESTFIINHVCRRLMAENLPVYTIHDSLLMPGRYVDRVKVSFLDEFARIGLRPTLHEEALSLAA